MGAKGWKQVLLDTSSMPGELTVNADELMLHRIVYNLLDNAIKFSHLGGRVEVSLSEEQHSSTLSIRDFGIGIFPKNLSLIFNEFRQVEEHPRRRFGGLGLGLVITRGLVHLHKGILQGGSGDVEMPLLEFEYVRQDGTTFWGEFHPSFIFDGQGKIAGTQGILRDISVRKKAEKENLELATQLQQSEKMRSIGQLAGGIAHDFNNQLSGLLGFGELLRRRVESDSTAAQYADGIIKAANRAADLTAKLLAFAPKAKGASSALDMHRQIEDVATVLDRSIDKKIKVELDLSAQAAVVHGDASLLQNALLNLALNSRDAMPEGGVLRFSMTPLVDPDRNPQSAHHCLP